MIFLKLENDNDKYIDNIIKEWCITLKLLSLNLIK